MLRKTAIAKTKNGCTAASALTKVTKPVTDAIVINKNAARLIASLVDIPATTFAPCSFTVLTKSLKKKKYNGIIPSIVPILEYANTVQ